MRVCTSAVMTVVRTRARPAWLKQPHKGASGWCGRSGIGRIISEGVIVPGAGVAETLLEDAHEAGAVQEIEGLFAAGKEPHGRLTAAHNQLDPFPGADVRLV